MDLLQREQVWRIGDDLTEGIGARETRRDDSFAPRRFVRQDGPHRLGRRGMGKVVGGMAPLAARGRGERQGSGTREENLPVQASRAPNAHPPLSVTLIHLT